jgi:2-C-methyl-D-erythritol 2,4-cyclodiphosphate synthase
MTAVRSGIGYDIHRLVPDRRLVLGGVRIDHPMGLAGHSDGDVLAHAIMDALLGATALGDLGTHFPSDDPAFAGADSLRLLERVVTLVKAAGYRIGSVDASVIAQAPRLAPHLAAMRERLSQALQIERDAVSVKATTNDGLGIVGAGEAIATLATVIVEKIEP